MHLQTALDSKFGKTSSYLFVSIMFLRFFCPALINPEKYDLLPGNATMLIVNLEDEQVTGSLKDQLLAISKFLMILVNPETLKPSTKDPLARLTSAPRRTSLSSSPSQTKSLLLSGKMKLEEFADEEYLSSCRHLLLKFGEALVVWPLVYLYFRTRKKFNIPDV
jgi:hypothetical protein